VELGRPLWREDGSVVYNCCWPSPAQSFSSRSPVGLVAMFYCLRLDTSLFVASYDSQGHGGDIRPRLQTGYYWLNSKLLQLIIPVHGPRRKHRCFVDVQFFPWEHVRLRSRYSVTAAVYLLISRSLPSNGSTCYNIIASNAWVFNKYWIGENVEESVLGLVWGTVPALAWRGSEQAPWTSVRILNEPAAIRTEDLPYTS
jgi:hypothetical protein